LNILTKIVLWREKTAEIQQQACILLSRPAYPPADLLIYQRTRLPSSGPAEIQWQSR